MTLSSGSWGLPLMLAACFVAGFASGFATAAYLWIRNLTSGKLLPGSGSGRVLKPQPGAEEAAATFTAADFDSAVKAGAQELMQIAKNEGRRMNIEEATEQAAASIRSVFPEL